ncbi:MAG: AMP-binding protein, partial [bacterium]|nr:AMP-binding protein [bacterium]
FEEQVERTPDNIALISMCLHKTGMEQPEAKGRAKLTYSQLNKKANQLARTLQENGVKRGSLVAVVMERVPPMVTAVMGILKAGGAYVPMEPYLPEARISLLLASLKLEYIIVDGSQYLKIQRITESLPGIKKILCMDSIDNSLPLYREAVASGRFIPSEKMDNKRGENLTPCAESSDMAYIIFTSGSTGTPKGVIEEHKPVINIIEWVNKTFGVGGGDKLLFLTSLSFDLSVYDIFGILSCGACIRLASGEEIIEPRQLLE